MSINGHITFKKKGCVYKSFITFLHPECSVTLQGAVTIGI